MSIFTIRIIQLDDLTDPNSTVAFGAASSGPLHISTAAAPVTLMFETDAEGDGFVVPPCRIIARSLIAPVTLNAISYGAIGTPVAEVDLASGFATTDGRVFFLVRLDGRTVGLTGTVLPQPGQIIHATNAPRQERDLPCFTAGTLVDTPDGPRAVESLRAGDLVNTVDAGPQPLVQVVQSEIGLSELMASPALRPIEIVRGALGNRRALQVAPHHGVLISGDASEVHFGLAEVLVPAKALAGGPLAREAPVQGPVLYVHLVFAEHHLVQTEGLVSESFRPAATPCGALTGSAPVRPILNRHEGHLLV